METPDTPTPDTPQGDAPDAPAPPDAGDERLADQPSEPIGPSDEAEQASREDTDEADGEPDSDPAE